MNTWISKFQTIASVIIFSVAFNVSADSTPKVDPLELEQFITELVAPLCIENNQWVADVVLLRDNAIKAGQREEIQREIVETMLIFGDALINDNSLTIKEVMERILIVTIIFNNTDVEKEQILTEMFEYCMTTTIRDIYYNW